MVMTEVDIGLIPANFLHITMVYLIFSTQGFIKNIFQEVCKDKENLKTIFVNIIQAYHHALIQECHNILIITFHLISIQ